MSEERNYENIVQSIEGKSLDEIAAMLSADTSLSDWIRLASDPPVDTLASAGSGCAVWVYDPAKGGWVCLREN